MRSPSIPEAFGRPRNLTRNVNFLKKNNGGRQSLKTVNYDSGKRSVVLCILFKTLQPLKHETSAPGISKKTQQKANAFHSF